MTNKEMESMVRDAAGDFPDEFGLKAFPGKRFKILLGQSYVSEGKVLLYLGIKRASNQWEAFCKGTPAELRKEIVR